MLLNFAYGLQSGYDAIEAKDEGTLYFTTDTKLLYKGSTLYNGVYKIVTDFPADKDAEGNIIYVKDGVGAKIWSGTKYIELTKPIVTSISASSTNENIPTSKAVVDFVNSEISKVTSNSTDKYVTGVTFTNSTGNLTVDKSGVTTDVALTGVAHNVTYASENRIITIPMYGGNDLVINLGKDAVVSSGSYNANTKSIDLTLTSGDPVSIPVASLIDIYTGKATNTATTSVSSDNKISVAVKVSAESGNTLVAKTDGLYVATVDQSAKMDKVAANTSTDQILTADATGNAKASGKKVGGATLASTPNANTVATEAAVNAVKTGLQTQITNNKKAIDVLKGSETTAGSVAKAVKDAKDALQAEIDTNANNISSNTAAIATLNGSDTTAGSVAKAVKDAKDALQAQITTNKNAIDVINGNASTEGSLAKTLADAKSYTETYVTNQLTTSLTWKTF